jgi:septum formation inhibitor MinC
LANTKEDETARIFATSFDPELICIGDTFTTVDTVSELGLDKPGEAAMVTLDSKNRELIFQHIPL